MGWDFADSRFLRRPACGKVVQPDRLAAEAARASLEIWNKATGGERQGKCVVAYRCKRCGELHVGLRRAYRERSKGQAPPERLVPGGQSLARGTIDDSSRDQRDLDIRYLIEEYDLE